jgi:serine/threonine-protein kinase
MLEIGSLIDGKYKILNKIGQGGMSIVYLAMNERANKQWAIKEIRKDGLQNYEVVKQGLIVETDMLKQLNHPNLPSIVDVIDSGDTFLIVMDYIEGQPLDKILRHDGAQPQEDVIEWAKQLCDVLGYLHSRPSPIVYRDMKPANVMLKPDGSIMLIDFGTAREFKAGSVADTTCLGTQGYAAPEQFGGQGQTDARTDIYTLGTTMYHLLTGHNPSEYPYEMYPIRQWNPNLSSGLEEIIVKCTQLNPQGRYQSCAELLFALEHYNELDVEYKARQEKKWRAFVAVAVLAVVFGCLSGGSKFMETKAVDDSYDSYVNEAKTATDKDEMIADYERAINLDPARKDAYLDLLENAFIGDDGVFANDEETKVRQIIRNQSHGNRQNIDHLRDSGDGYAQFAYDLGIAYFFYYNESADTAGGASSQGDKAASATWFGYAVDADDVSQNLREQANAYNKIAENYLAIIVPRPDGGKAEVTYADYWRDLEALADGNLVTKYQNAVTALRIYNEIANLVVMHSSELSTDGVSMSEIETRLAEMETRIASDVKTDTKIVNDWKRIIQTNINSARTNLRTAYGIASTAPSVESGETKEGE